MSSLPRPRQGGNNEGDDLNKRIKISDEDECSMCHESRHLMRLPEEDGGIVCLSCVTCCRHCHNSFIVPLPRLTHDLKGVGVKGDRICKACSRICERCNTVYVGKNDLVYDDIKGDWACDQCLCFCEGCQAHSDDGVAGRKGPFGNRMMRLCDSCVESCDKWRNEK